MSPKTPRDISGSQLIKVLARYGYEINRQKGSHIRLSKTVGTATHHVTVPDHNPLKLGTLSAILNDVCPFLKIDREELLKNIK